jgi:fluoride exporter
MRSLFAACAAVGLGSALGGICRYLLTLFVVSRLGPGLPVATFLINLTGSFAIGVVSELGQTRAVGIDPLLRIALTVGFLGGYTTFSTFAYELLTLGAEREWRLSLTYAVASVLLGVLACYAGIVAARLTARPA